MKDFPVDCSTLAGSVGSLATELKPAYDRLKEKLFGSPKLAVDETQAPVLDPDRAARTLAKMQELDPEACLADIMANLANRWPMKKLDALRSWNWPRQDRDRYAFWTTA